METEPSEMQYLHSSDVYNVSTNTCHTEVIQYPKMGMISSLTLSYRNPGQSKDVQYSKDIK